MSAPKLLTPADIAESCSVPVETVRMWAKRGRGPKFLKIGRHLRVHPDDWAAFLAASARK